MSPEKIERLCLALARGRSVADAANEAGMSRRSGYRALEDQAVRARVAELRHELTAQAVGRLADSANEASDTLRKMLADDMPPAVRVRAAKEILAQLVTLQSHADLTQRITDLERRLDGSPTTP